MNNLLKKTAAASAVAVALSLATPAFAADTSSAVRGKVVTQAGQPLANTKITIIHVPTGAKRVIETNAEGNYSASGLKVGGPYKIEIDSETYQDQTLTDVYLQLGEVRKLTTALSMNDVERIAVTGSVIAETAPGSSSYFGQDAIAGASSLTRDIKDVVRANPLVTILPGSDREMSVAGMNPKFNSITVDGISQNDDFGLNGGGYPTQRSPIPFDALDQVTVDVAPFNAGVSGFSGALINSVFKSGTNEFKGGFFYETLNDDMAGTPETVKNGKRVEVPQPFDETTYGVSLGGPLIEDTLFFFTSYEKYDAPKSVEWGPAGSGTPNETDATLEELAEIREIASSVYGLNDLGDWAVTPVEEDEKLVAKIDWNINDEHRASFTYQYNKGNRTRNTSDRENELRLSSHWYNKSEELNNFAVKVYSDWSDDLSTEISITQKSVKTLQDSFDMGMADVTIENLKSGGDIAFGPDQYRHANYLENDTFTFKFDATYLTGDHSIKFGTDYTNIDIFNLFVHSSKGVIVFDGIDAFREGNVEEYFYQNGTNNDANNAAADFNRESLALYIHDTWAYNDDLTLDFGLRYEVLGSDDKPLYNANSEARTGYDNTESLDGIDIFLPRVGFNYMVNDDLTIRGGVGRFSGGSPNVWISNAYSNNGVNVGVFEKEDFETSPTPNNNIITSIHEEGIDKLNGAVAEGDVNLTDPDFKLPSDWRYQLAADYLLDIPGVGEDFSFSAEAIYVQKIDQQWWVDASLLESDKTGTTADGGLNLYEGDERRYDLMLTNSDKDGRSLILSTSLAKAFDNGFKFSASYTNQDITEAHGGSSSTARSNYRYNVGLNRNEAYVGAANYEIEHSFKLILGYETELFDGYATNFDVFFERRSGKPFSYTTNFNRFTTDRNTPDEKKWNSPWDLISPGLFGGNYLPYIPTAGDENVIYTGNTTEAEVLARIEEAGLSGYAGGYAPKNTFTTPWVNTLDLTVRQEIPGLMEGHKGSLYFTVDNLLNLIDSSQGKTYVNDFGTSRLYTATIDPDTSKYVIDGVKNDSHSFEPLESTWRIKVGVSYKF
ncbi:TonB-dependent receptor [Psychrobium sp. 1_MG-2023]|uniref:TonB-dependent receptor n=1 Tax=Psychrobium sp. 1_MG-2023 TaxID=3062624 RepID=UPI000C32C427|nr:TonB-dependent receptor [Psychrobium sp. 1_MG-2023]MDP2560532.1 TonB-dependent receptor [Psychrobium sp. 1_MG-2023]PKF57523.1 hypothetical protein CW748_06420 [Alteromonadales bacterium alter-6D02]